MWLFKKKEEPVQQQAGEDLFGTHDLGAQEKGKRSVMPIIEQPKGSMAMDSEMGGEVVHDRSSLKARDTGMSESVMSWYAWQTFIGYHTCALIGQNWLIHKACRMPAKDAVRQGWEIDGDDAVLEQIKRNDKQMDISNQLAELCSMGRMYGIRISLFRVESTDPEYYEKPFNVDGVAKGSYKGVVQIDPQWCTPELTDANLTDPASPNFYQPTFWRIGNKLYHHSHLTIYIPYKIPAFLANTYRFGGLSIPQMAYERVYASERTANEAPILVMTKRLNTFKAAAGANLDSVRANMAQMAEMRDNHGVLVHGEGEAYGQTETTLNDLDAVIMTNYQLVSAISEVPATKLMGTSPKGFGASGEYEEASYRELLESIQSEAYNPLLDGHYRRLVKSLGVDTEIRVQWAALDSPTASEFADIELKKAQEAQAYQAAGAIDGEDIREVITANKESTWFNLAAKEIEPDDLLNENPFEY